MDGNPKPADILIEGSRIASIRLRDQSNSLQFDATGATVLQASDRLVTPGFFNAHYHSHDVFLKGCFEPNPLEMWLISAMPRSYPPRSLDEIRTRTLLGASECIRSGITTVQDMITLHPLDVPRVEAVISAYEEIGIRAVVSLQVADVPPLETTPFWRETVPPHLQDLLQGHPFGNGKVQDPVDVIEHYVSAGRRHDLLSWAISPSSPERCSLPLLHRLAELAERHSLPVYSHIYISKAEAVNARRQFRAYGGSLLRLVDAIGLLNARLSLAHGVWLDDDEVQTLSKAGANVVLNVVSNLKNKNGVAPIRRLIDAGVNVALGCDNFSCTDVQNMFQAMKMTCLLAAVTDPEPGRPNAMDVLRAATVGGARTAGLQQELGLIAPGMRADLVLFDLSDPAFVPLNNAARQLVYAESGRAVETVVVNGRIVMENRSVKTINEATLRDAVDNAMMVFRGDAEKVIQSAAILAPYLLKADKKTWAQQLGFSRYIGRT